MNALALDQLELILLSASVSLGSLDNLDCAKTKNAAKRYIFVLRINKLWVEGG